MMFLLKTHYCLEATDIRVGSVTEATDRDRSAHTVEGSALHITQGIEELLQGKGALRPVSCL